VNLAQIRSAVPDTSYTNKKPQTDGAKNRNFRSSLRAVKKITYSAETEPDLRAVKKPYCGKE